MERKNKLFSIPEFIKRLEECSPKKFKKHRPASSNKIKIKTYSLAKSEICFSRFKKSFNNYDHCFAPNIIYEKTQLQKYTEKKNEDLLNKIRKNNKSNNNFNSKSKKIIPKNYKDIYKRRISPFKIQY